MAHYDPFVRDLPPDLTQEDVWRLLGKVFKTDSIGRGFGHVRREDAMAFIV